MTLNELLTICRAYHQLGDPIIDQMHDILDYVTDVDDLDELINAGDINENVLPEIVRFIDDFYDIDDEADADAAPTRRIIAQYRGME